MKLTIATECGGLPAAGQPIYVAAEFLETAASTLACNPAETGGPAFGPADRAGVDLLEVDLQGSGAATATTYTPATDWLLKRMNFWLTQPLSPRLLDGIVHTHPGEWCQPSNATVDGSGDLGMAARFLSANDHMNVMVLFIITHTESSSPRLWPWVVDRDLPLQPRLAPVVVVASATLFPPRIFPPELAAKMRTDFGRLAVSLNVEFIEKLIGGPCRVSGRVVCATSLAGAPEVLLPQNFPVAAPIVAVIHGAQRFVMPFRWARNSYVAPEVRLAQLLRHAAGLNREV